MENASKKNKNPVYWYHFDRVPSWGNDPRCSQPDGGVCHGAEVAFVFGSTIAHPFTPDELQLSEMMRWYWASFVKSGGDPNEYAKTSNSNNTLYIEWDKYDFNGGKETTILLNTKKLNSATPFQDDVTYCDFWDNEIGYDWLNRV